jgi:hypothetical protein
MLDLRRVMALMSNIVHYIGKGKIKLIDLVRT